LNYRFFGQNAIVIAEARALPYIAAGGMCVWSVFMRGIGATCHLKRSCPLCCLPKTDKTKCSGTKSQGKLFTPEI